MSRITQIFGSSIVLRSFFRLRKRLVVINLTSVIESFGGWKLEHCCCDSILNFGISVLSVPFHCFPFFVLI